MNVGVIVKNFGMSQLAYLVIHQCNISKEQCYGFFYDIEFPCVRPNFSCFNLSELHGFDGLVIATDIDSCITMNNSVGNTKKIFYVWDLEWLRKGKGDFSHNMEAFRNPDTTLICRSADHARAVENYCNRTVDMVVPSMNIHSIIEKYGK